MVDIPESVQNLIVDHHVRKNARIHFPNGEYADIINDHISQDSLIFTENFNGSGDLIFGQMESNILEISVKDCPDIVGKKIFVSIEVDVSSLARVSGETKEDVPYPVFSIPLGAFIVQTCPEDNYGMRKITAYSNLLNTGIEVLSDFESDKLLYYQNKNTTFTFNPVFYALDNVSSVVHINAQNFPDFDSHRISATDTDVTASIYNPVGFEPPERYHLACRVSGKRFDIRSYRDAINLLAYGCGDALNAIGIVVKALRQYVNEYMSPIIQIDDDLGYPYTPYMDINDTLIKMGQTSGFVDAKYPAASSKFDLWLPYSVEISLVNDTTHQTEDVKVIDLFDPDNVSAAVFTVGQYGDLLIPDITHTMVREEHTGIYIKPQTKDLPDPVNTLKAWLELNGMFLMQNRDDKYDFYKVLAEQLIFPADDLYPDSTLFPRGGEGMIKPQHIKWDGVSHESAYVTPYTIATAMYKDANDKEKWFTTSLAQPELFDAPDKVKDFSDNLIISEYVHTAAVVSALLENFLYNVIDIYYVKADVDSVGFPFLEAGDPVEIYTHDAAFTTIILQRIMRGVQVLEDNITSD